jgi:valyl-tRNA synthetase
MQGHQPDPKIKAASGWAARKDDSVPFRDVYIHALVRDADRQKMSKTKGNVLDPLAVIEKYGTDATRFTLAAMASPGTDIAFNESRTDGYRAFANKIWNAARFMFMNVDRAEQAGIWSMAEFRTAAENNLSSANVARFQATTLEDRWILSRFNRVTREVNEALSTNRFHEAANQIYDFFWGEFCDWYIELIKPRLLDDDKKIVRVACENMVGLFEAALRLLHPVMPFITEEIWYAIYDGKPPLKSIAFAAYPASEDAQVDIPAETSMAILQDFIVSVRNLRAELKVEQKLRVPIEVFSHDAETADLIQQNGQAIERLANVESITTVTQERARQSPSRVTSRFDVRIIYEKKIDVAAEIARLRKELEKVEKELASAESKLADERFLAKAPPHVVEGNRKRAEELKVLRDRILSQLDELG